jgi:hypothetical protein
MDAARRCGSRNVNVDGKVDAADLNIVALNWIMEVDGGGCDGDFNGDGTVDATDLNPIGLNWPGAVGGGRAVARTPKAALSLARPVVALPVDGVVRASLTSTEPRPSDSTSAMPEVVDFVLARTSYRRHREAEYRRLTRQSLEPNDGPSKLVDRGLGNTFHRRDQNA